MYRIRLHGRDGQGIKTASRILGVVSAKALLQAVAEDLRGMVRHRDQSAGGNASF